MPTLSGYHYVSHPTTFLKLDVYTDSLNSVNKKTKLSPPLSLPSKISVNATLTTISEQLDDDSLHTSPLPAIINTPSPACHVVAQHTAEESEAELQDPPQIKPPSINWFDSMSVQERFDPPQCRIPSHAEIAQFFSRVVVLTPYLEHVLHCSPWEFYLIKALRFLVHSFENGTALTNPVTNSRLQMNYPQSLDVTTDEVSIVKGDGQMGLYRKHFGRL